MSNELSLSFIQSQLSNSQRHLVDEHVVQEIQKLAEDPEYGAEFLDTYMMHLNVLKQNARANHVQYINAIKFFILVESENSLVDAYIKVFPERFAARNKGKPQGQWDKAILNSEASRFNRSMLVNEIRRLTTIPVQLIHRHLLHEAILETAHLMKNARSEMVRQKAAATLITELKPPEESQINIRVDDGASSVIDELRRATEQLAAAENTAILAGRSIKDIAKSKIILGEAEDVTDE